MNTAIILSGGVGSRMRSDGFPKQYLTVEGKPVLIYAMEAFEQCSAVDRIVLVAAEEWKDTILNWLKQYKINKVCAIAPSGETRQESILSGLHASLDDDTTDDDLVIIHDAARPMVSNDLIKRCLEGAAREGGCMPVLPVKDTIYTSLDGTNISGLLNRSTLFGGQAPEAFRLKAYAAIHKEASPEEIRNCRGTSEMAFRHGMKVIMIPGEEENFKLTTPEDLKRFEQIVKKGTQ